MPVREITFEEPGLAEGTPIPSITKDGVTVRFLTRVAIFRPGVTTESPPKALMNYGQDILDDAGSSRPIIFEFSHLQHWVRVRAGLNERDPSTPNGVTARLVAYNSSGREVSSDSQRLGNGPTPIRTLLEVSTSGHVIRHVKLEYDGNVREVIDNLRFQAGQSVPIPHDTDAPVVEILQPTEGQQVNSRNILISGRIREVNGVTLVINGRSVPVQLVGPGVYSFSAEVTLPEGTNTIEAIATDEDHNTGSDRRTIDIRIPASFLVSDLVFTQNGLLDPATPRPTRRVAGKTSLFRLRLEIRTADGRPTSVDAANVIVERDQVSQFLSPGQLRPATGNQFGWSGNDTIADGQQVYFFIEGPWLKSAYLYRFILRLSIRGQVVFEQPLVSDWSFQDIRGVTMLLVPQHVPLDKVYTRALIQVLYETGRMFPVPDGIASLDSDNPGGIRYAVLAPVSYQGHTDPADNSVLGTSVTYDEGFLLHDHDIMDGATVPCPGEVLPINFTFAEDENRNGMFDAQELARLMAPPGGGTRPIEQRMNNWDTFARQSAESLRLAWNKNNSHASRRAIVIVTSSLRNRADTTAQNRTGWEGNAGGGQTSFWASIDIDRNGFIPHETGHTFGFNHTAGLNDPVRPCQFPVEGVNLLTRQIIDPAYSVMCPELGGGSSILFMNPIDYDTLFDRLVAAGGQD